MNACKHVALTADVTSESKGPVPSRQGTRPLLKEWGASRVLPFSGGASRTLGIYNVL
jgi:hypothetical protein